MEKSKKLLGKVLIAVTIVWGFYLNRMFPPEDENKPIIEILTEIVLQSIAIAISVFYIRKICKMFPLLINFKGYRENKTSEYGGEVILSIIFMTTQKHIINKINLLNRRYLA